MVELVGNIPDDVVLQAQLDILYGQTPDITIKAHELPEESEPTVEKSGTLAEPIFDIGIPQAMGAVAAREYAKQAETARDAAILAGETAKEELNGIVASADDALDQKIAETGTLLDEKVATAAQRASEAASSAVAAAQKATAAEQAMQGAQAAQAQAEQSAQEAAENTAMAKDFASGQPVTYSGTPVSIAYAGAQRIASITAYGENAQGGTTEAPMALTGVDSVQVCGNNLLPNKAETQTVHGITYTINKDKSVTVKGTSTGSWATLVLANKLSLPTGSYTLAGNGITDDVMLIVAKDTSGTTTVRSAGKDNSVFSITSRRTDLIVYITVKPNTTVDMTIYPMLNLGSTILPYEPYQGSLTTLPIPRSLRRVGDVRDVCRTRVKSVYDKRIVIDQNSIINMSGEASIVGTSRRFNVPAEDIPITNDAVIEPVRCNILPARPSGGVSGTYALDAPGISLQNNQSVSQPNINIRVPGCKTLEEIKAWLTDNPLTVYYQSTSYNGTNGLDVCQTEYQTDYIESYADESITTAWISSTGALSTGAEVAYVLSSPETYATDPLDIDNAAGPLTVMTGGEVEVRMTELIGSRSPELTAKMDKATYDADGDGVVDEAEKVSNALTLKNAAGEVVATFDGSEAAILQLTAALVGALGKTEKAADSSKLAGLAPVVDNPGPNNRNTWYFPFTGTNNRDGTRKYYAALYADNATTAGRASNLSMGLNGTDLWVYYS